MQVTRSRQFKANIDNYETFPVMVSVTVNHQDMGYTDEEWRELMAGDGRDDALDEIQDFARDEMAAAFREEVEAINRLRDGSDVKRKSLLGHV